ncbi:MAG: thiamine phosphate synthase [Oscillospiraceae bacterium]|nr:thiamine phosphate synthase [Oscillospiraceae bacterium]
MCEAVCVTQSSAVSGDFSAQLEKIAAAGADRIILREKQLSEEEYISLAKKAAQICGKYGVPLWVHTYISAARALGTKNVHLSFKAFTALDDDVRQAYDIGVSVHSASEAVTAAKLGAAYVTAGHIFPTDCKKGLPPRGLDYLSEICSSADIPVYAIGGITPENAPQVISAGADGVCIMSGLMKAPEPNVIIEKIHSL